MDSTRIKCWLSILITFAFIGVIFVLLEANPPAPLKDILLILLGALVTTTKDVYGYWFGSSEGSARKTELMSSPDVILPVPGDGPEVTYPTDQRGFIRLRLLLPLMFLLALLFALICGCATTTGTKEPAQMTIGKSLLAVKTAIISAAEAVDVLCAAGKLAPDNCAGARNTYGQAKIAYDAAVDAYLMLPPDGDPVAIETELTRVQTIMEALLALTDPSSGPNGGGK